MTIITLTGDNDYQIIEQLNKLEQNFRGQYGEMGVERIDAEEIETAEFVARISARGLFTQKRFIAVRGMSKNKLLSEKIEQIIDSLGDDIELVLIEPNADKRSRLYKFLLKHTDCRQFTKPDEQGSAAWVEGYVLENGGKISHQTAVHLVERLTPDQLLLKNELDKLLQYQLVIDRDTIDLLTEPSPQSNVFNLLDAAFAGDGVRTTKLYHELREQNIDPLRIMGMIGWQLNVLAITSAAGKRDVTTIAKDSGLNPYTIRKSQQVAKRLGSKKLKVLLTRTVELEYELKTKTMDADAALQQLLLEVALG